MHEGPKEIKTDKSDFPVGTSLTLNGKLGLIHKVVALYPAGLDGIRRYFFLIKIIRIDCYETDYPAEISHERGAFTGIL